MTRGERNANPGNLRRVKGVMWEGESPVQTDDAFVQFTDPIWGIRAIVRVLRSYERHGIHTIEGAINRWAPANENNSKGYVADVCLRCGVNPDTVISFENIMPQLVAAIIRYENGEQIYSPEQIARGIELA